MKPSSQYLPPSPLSFELSPRLEPALDSPEAVLARCSLRLSHRHGRAVVQAALRKVTAIFDAMDKENARISLVHLGK